MKTHFLIIALSFVSCINYAIELDDKMVSLEQADGIENIIIKKQTPSSNGKKALLFTALLVAGS